MDYADLIARLEIGCVCHAKRWSGDTHNDLGGTVDEEATDALTAEAAAALEAVIAERDKAARELAAHMSAGVRLSHRAEAAEAALKAERDMAVEGWEEATKLIALARQQYSEEKAAREKAEADLKEAVELIRAVVATQDKDGFFAMENLKKSVAAARAFLTKHGASHE